MNENRQLNYHAQGGALLWLQIRCLFLTVITLGIYGSWAKARTLKFHYGKTTFGGSPLAFEGNGLELFLGALKGFFILLATMIVPIGLYVWGLVSILQGDSDSGMVAVLAALVVYLLVIVVIIPLAVNSSLRYRFARTSWRSLRWAYRGSNRQLLPLYLKGFFLTILTLGIYGNWFTAQVNAYVYSHLEFGSIRFRFKGEGKELLKINLLGILLSIVTLGIYLFWYQKRVYEWTYNNLEVLQGETFTPLTSTITGGGLLVLTLTNVLLLIVTLGIATPWVIVRSNRYMLSNLMATADLDPEAISQTEGVTVSATGEEVGDILDLGDWGIL